MKCLNNRCACEADGECYQNPLGCECHIPADGVSESANINPAYREELIEQIETQVIRKPNKRIAD